MLSRSDPQFIRAGYALRAPAGPDALVEASLDGGSLTISVPDGSTADGLTAVTVVSKNAAGLPVSWTVLVQVVAVEGYTVQEQAWGETTWHAPEDRGDDWALDIDVDSDNDGTLSESPLEDAVEDRAGSGPGQVGKRSFVNLDDDNKNGQPDMFDSRSDYRTPAPEDDDFHDKDFAEVRLKTSSTDGLEGSSLWLGVDLGLRVWADTQKQCLSELEEVEKGPDGGINLPWNFGYRDDLDTWYVWNIDTDGVSFPETVYVEGRLIGKRSSTGGSLSQVVRVLTQRTSSNATQYKSAWNPWSGRIRTHRSSMTPGRIRSTGTVLTYRPVGTSRTHWARSLTVQREPFEPSIRRR